MKSINMHRAAQELPKEHESRVFGTKSQKQRDTEREHKVKVKVKPDSSEIPLWYRQNSSISQLTESSFDNNITEERTSLQANQSNRNIQCIELGTHSHADARRGGVDVGAEQEDDEMERMAVAIVEEGVKWERTPMVSMLVLFRLREDTASSPHATEPTHARLAVVVPAHDLASRPFDLVNSLTGS